MGTAQRRRPLIGILYCFEMRRASAFARMTFAADVPAVLRQATALLTEGRPEPPTMMRWQTLNSAAAVTLATLLARGADPVDLKGESTDTAVKALVSGKGWKQEIHLTSTLEPPAGNAK